MKFTKTQPEFVKVAYIILLSLYRNFFLEAILLLSWQNRDYFHNIGKMTILEITYLEKLPLYKESALDLTWPAMAFCTSRGSSVVLSRNCWCKAYKNQKDDIWMFLYLQLKAKDKIVKYNANKLIFKGAQSTVVKYIDGLQLVTVVYPFSTCRRYCSLVLNHQYVFL